MIHLGKVLAQYKRRAARLECMALDALKGGTLQQRDERVSFVLIELQTAMARVARYAYLAGAMCGRTACGMPLRAQLFPSEDLALLAAATIFKPTARNVPGRDEPCWQSFDQLGKIAGRVTLANAADVTAATSLHPDTGKLVTAARNFYAHRNGERRANVRDTFRKYYGRALVEHPTVGLLTIQPGRAFPPVLEWIAHHEIITEVLCGH